MKDNFSCTKMFGMLALVLTVALGTVFAVFATQNTGTVDLNFGQYFLPKVPIYLLILIPLLVGMLIAYLYHTLRTLSYDLTESEQKKEIRRLKEEAAEANKRAHKLELENLKIKKDNGEFDEDSLK